MTETETTAIAQMAETIREIGVARFVGRINSGVVDPETGYQAVEAYIANQKHRPFLSRWAAALLNRPDVYLTK